MFTPSEILEKQFKAGLGYDKKDVESFLHELSSDYEALQSENNDLTKKLKVLSDNLDYYKSIEKTLHRALILAEKTAQDTRATALREADSIELEAKTKADLILADSKKNIVVLEHKTLNLMQQYDVFKIHFENLLNAQIELLNSKSFAVNTDDFSYKEASNLDITNLEALNLNTANTESTDPDLANTGNIRKALEAINEDAASALQAQEDVDQFQLNFLQNNPDMNNYQTEDGFEFFTMKEE